ncbi:hypothetical protein MUK70_19915 [Dyadobacter chenwenxiniae]|uniref:hypothetical protein n=1 Tax=Dyadobacter chenwenxiniae TaxID=2906456 RepID=UPI001FD23415|nr:hypothetical protein [Dyadobacter chenwenxiniae]UON81328.1 hypothetical protein MUK70_19915 [Dyadobacter chenwenxiniae]
MASIGGCKVIVKEPALIPKPFYKIFNNYKNTHFADGFNHMGQVAIGGMESAIGDSGFRILKKLIFGILQNVWSASNLFLILAGK